jgi:LacI family transcriptional regulator
VAEAAGVSKTTAVFVLNDRPNFSVPEETRLRVRNAAKSLGYRRNGLAAALSRGKSGSIGIFLKTNTNWSNPEIGEEYLLGITLGATRAAAARGLRLTTIAYTDENPLLVDELTDHRVDGLIVVGILEEKVVRDLYATGFPCVTIGSGYSEHRVTADNIGGAKLAVEHLIALGHRRIAYASPDITEAELERGQGWREAMAEHGLCCDGLRQDWLSLKEWLVSGAPDRPTAVFCRNDGYAAFLIRALKEQGIRVPEDISLVGFDSGIVAKSLDLTSVQNPLPEQTTVAIDLLLRRIAGEETPARVTLPTQLDIRRSTAPLHDPNHP